MNDRVSPVARIALVLMLAVTIGLDLGVAWRPAAGADAAALNPSRLGIVADVGTRYGIYGQQDRPIGVLADTGAKWAKEEFRWDWVEPSRDRWTWAFMDEAVDKERARGMEILGQLDYTAGWAVGSNAPVAYTPPPLDLWRTYVAQTVARYKGRVRAWQVWNEPNAGVFWSGSKEQFAQLQAATYDAIKQVDRDALVVGPSITGVDEDWLNAMDWGTFDVLGLDLYVPPAFLNDQGYSLWTQGLPNLQRVVAAHGGKAVWLTEWGYSSARCPQAWCVGDEGQQARYLVQYLAEVLAFPGLRIERAFMYDFNDDAPGGGYGVTRNDWAARKPSFAAFRAAVDRLDGAQPVGKFNAGQGIFGFRFLRAGKLIDVVWAPGGGAAVIPSGDDGEVFDLSGQRRVVGRSGTVLRVPVGADPVYVVHGALQRPRFTQRQKDAALADAQALMRKVSVDLVLYLGCGIYPSAQQGYLKRPLPCKVSPAALDATRKRLKVFAYGLSEVEVARLIQDLRIYNDPPDPGFTDIDQPETPAITYATVDDGVTQAEADADNALASTVAQEVGLEQAMVTSVERALGAEAAGASDWEARQDDAARDYADRADDLLNAEAGLRATVEGSLVAAGAPTVDVTADDVRALQETLAANGLPRELNQALSAMGIDGTQVAQATGMLASADAAGLAGSFPQDLADPGLVGATQRLAGELTEFSGAPARQCFAETGKCMGGRFLAYWRAHGGLAINGFPVSDEFTETLEDGQAYTVQYFERVRMELHPENQAPFDVLLGQFGRRLHPADPPAGAQPGATYFAQTGHNVGPRFLAYWQANGGLAQFGYPLGEEIQEQLEDGNAYTVQYFERARFEYHPENPPPYDVELGQFGRRILNSP